MKVVIIDDELPCVEELAFLLRKYPDIEITGVFTSAPEALEAVESLQPDAVFLDIDMPHMDGLQLALRMQAICASVIVIFVTAYAKYALDAFRAYPLAYILKPIREARLDDAVEHLRKQYVLLHPAGVGHARLRIKCFGRFEVLTDREIRWGTRRVKELFLYLVDQHGVAPTKCELIHILFGGSNDKKTLNNLYVTAYMLRSLLDTLDNERRYIGMADDYSLFVAPGVCDYVDFMRFAVQNAVITPKNAVEAARTLNLCAGTYLEGEYYAWVSDSASMVEVEYERIALGLAGHYAAAGLSGEAENVLCTLLARNFLSEEGHTALLDLHMENGDRAAFVAGYETYARMLRRELRTKPAELYRKHYSNLKR